MSTYNGEQFLADQIESIQHQTVKDWTLYIRDDGSSDKTPDIIRRYAQADSRIILLMPTIVKILVSSKTFIRF
ncbi:Alpha-L-Rha alpha-1,3-L-rhamnosyl transferase [Streptococcus sp. HSISB1]|nr:Alpha-L-Rha alpha-1,3-L-rhamnosyl transferase [Streptococcus sp. HSISB1]